MEISEEKINENAENILALINAVIPEPRRTVIIAMLEALKDLYFVAPASSRVHYHYAFPGGLAAHSLNVYKNLRKLNKEFKFEFSEEAMLVCGLFHDLGKACATNCTDEHYTPTIEEWKNKRGIVYDTVPDLVYFPNQQRSMYILQKFGVTLSAEEYQAILLNDGQYIDDNRPYSMKECPLAMVLHMADRMTCHFEANEKTANSVSGK